MFGVFLFLNKTRCNHCFCSKSIFGPHQGPFPFLHLKLKKFSQNLEKKFLSFSSGSENFFQVREVRSRLICFCLRVIILFSFFSTISGCKTTSGKKCVFPFNYNKKTCWGPLKGDLECCNLDNDPRGAWCATEVNGNGDLLTPTSRGYCESFCQPQGIFLALSHPTFFIRNFYEVKFMNFSLFSSVTSLQDSLFGKFCQF